MEVQDNIKDEIKEKQLMCQGHVRRIREKRRPEKAFRWKHPPPQQNEEWQSLKDVWSTRRNEGKTIPDNL